MMMWWSPGFLFLVPLLFLISASPDGASADIVINELYYDHTGSDTGWEYVELYNGGTTPVDLSSCRLEFIDGASGSPRLLWEGVPGVVLSAGERLLVRGENVPVPGVPLAGSIENGPDAVRLLLGPVEVDIVGYGAVSYCEGEPAPDVPAGVSLSRKPDGFDSDSNISDFVPAEPTPGLPNFFGRDLALAATGIPLPCRGESFTVEFVIVNKGLDRFTDRVLLLCSVGASVSEREVDVDVANSETVAASLELPFAPSSGFLLEARIESASDENARNDTVRVMLCSSPGVAVVSEIMYRPSDGGSEWIEISCREAAGISLSRWYLSDATGTKRLISAGDLPLGPGGYAVLAQDSALFTRDHPLCPAAVVEPEGGWPWLNDGGDEVALYDLDGTLIERVQYCDLVGEERGRSIERFSSDVCSSFPGGLWHRSSSPSGSTPGETNSIDLPAVPPHGSVEVSPNPFCPARDGAVWIRGMSAAWETGLLVRVFDIDGVEVARLFGGTGGARAFSCEWDGRAAGGRESPTGLYICVVEFMTQGGGVCRREKRCIALYR